MTEALIIGAGPTGLTLACELIKRGLKVRLIEQLTEENDQSRALALHSRTLEVFERMGILDPFLKEGRIVQHINVYSNRNLLLEVDFQNLETTYPFVLSIPQSRTEHILANHFAALGGHLERGIALQTLHGTQAVLLHPNGTSETVDAKWVFGCDGAHSTVRHSLNLPFAGEQFPEAFALADVAMHTSLSDDQFHIFFYPHGVGAIVPLPEKNRFRIIALLLGQKAKQPFQLDIAFFQQVLDECSGLSIKIGEAVWMSKFIVHRRLTPKMRVGNVFLLGDAAHIHSPIGGQGLNTSVQDAFNLAWKIGLVHHRMGKEILLDSFEAERLPVAKTVLRNTTLATQLVTTRFLKHLLFPIAAFLLRKSYFQKRLMWGISELKVAYPNSPIIDYSSNPHWKGPKPGERAPDALLTNQRRLFSLFYRLEHTLLCFGEEEFIPLLQKINASFSQTIRPLQLSKDERGEAQQRYQVASPCFYLIRPDGVIAYCSRSLDPKPFLAYLERIISEDLKAVNETL